MAAPSEKAFEEANEVVRALRRLAMAQRGRKVEMLREVGLQAGQDVVLLELSRLERPSQSELAQAVEVDEPSIGRSIQRLEKKDLVRRSQDPDDARRRFVELTPAGAKLVPALKAIYIQFADEAAGRNGSPEHTKLMETLTETSARIGR